MSFLVRNGNSTRKHWDDFWQDQYPKLAGLMPEYEKELVQSLMRALDVQGRQLLEVGCGSAGNSVFLAARGASVSVLDYSRKALKVAAEHAAAKAADIRLVEGTASKLPFRDASFDGIYHSGFLEHFHDPASILREQIRTLKPGGVLLVDVPQKYTLYTLKKQLAMRRGRWYAGWETQFSPGELHALIRSVGLEVVAMYPRGIALSYGWTARKFLHGFQRWIGGQPGEPGVGQHARHDWLRRIALYFTDSIGIIGRKANDAEH